MGTRERENQCTSRATHPLVHETGASRRSPRDKIAEGRTIIYPIIIQTLHVDVEFLNRRVAGKWRVALGNPWLWHTCHLG